VGKRMYHSAKWAAHPSHTRVPNSVTRSESGIRVIIGKGNNVPAHVSMYPWYRTCELQCNL
jgi:hypothetical protein